MRVTLNNDHNDTTECFKRTMTDTHLLDTSGMPTPSIMKECIAWFVGAIIAVCCAIVIAITLQNANASIQDAGITQSTRIQASAEKACPPNHAVVWLGIDSMICLKEQP